MISGDRNKIYSRISFWRVLPLHLPCPPVCALSTGTRGRTHNTGTLGHSPAQPKGRPPQHWHRILLRPPVFCSIAPSTGTRGKLPEKAQPPYIYSKLLRKKKKIFTGPGLGGVFSEYKRNLGKGPKPQSQKTAGNGVHLAPTPPPPGLRRQKS